MKKFLNIAILVLLASAVALISLSQAVEAAFISHNIMDDGTFDKSSTMSASEIDAWLNTNFPNSCISTHAGFLSQDPVGYNPTDGFKYGANVSAGRVIYDAAQAYEMNPQVLLATLQKEESLVTGASGCSTLAYVSAVGYSCPDGGSSYNYSGINLYTLNGHTVTSVHGTCVNNALSAGFSRQIIHAAWLLKFGEQRSEGNTDWAIIKGNWDNSDDPDTCYSGPMTQGYRKRCSSDAHAIYYDGYTTIDGKSTHMDTGATATFYWYTPHFSGNQHFVDIFTQWFGPTHLPTYKADLLGRSTISYLKPGLSKSVTLTYRNVGTGTWYDSTSHPDGVAPTVLAATNDLYRISQFNGLFERTDRPVVTYSQVFESDGTTPADDQHVVEPNQIIRFGFTFVAPMDIGARQTYTEWFEPVHQPTTTMKGSTYLHITIPTLTRTAAAAGTSGLRGARPGWTLPSFVKVKNTGNVVWYDKIEALDGVQPLELSTARPTGRTSLFGADYEGGNRLTTVLDKVYAADGHTLATDQHTVRPGETAVFRFNMSVPAKIKAGMYTEWVGLRFVGAPGLVMGDDIPLNLKVLEAK